MAERRKRGPGSRGGRVVTKKLTRGPRKGQTVRGYESPGGQFSEIKTNARKGNPRAGKKFITTRDSKGRRVHTYEDGSSVTLKGSRRAKRNRKRRIAAGSAVRRSVKRDVRRRKPVRKRKRKR